MLKLTMSMMMIFFSLMMFFINHPLAMGLFILLQTMIISMFMGLFINTYWFSYILFMVFMGGLLVLFIYVSSIASNELMKISIMFKMIFFLTICFSLLISYMMYKNLWTMNMFKNFEMNNMFKLFYFLNENNINLSKLYDKHTYFLTIMLILYLFITLIAVIKITNIFFGPLRSFS